MDKEKQEQGAINTYHCDEAHNVESEEEEILDQDEEVHIEESPILVHVDAKEAGPVLTNLFQPEVIGEIVKGCVQKYPTCVDVLNEYEFAIAMPSEMIGSIVAKDLQEYEAMGRHA